MNRYALPLIGALLVSLPAGADSNRLRGVPGPRTPFHALGTFIGDPGFEAGTPNPSWTESSTNFGTPLCTVAACGTGGGIGPHSGSWWAWFGGILNTPEDAAVSQSVTLPVGASAMLSFWYAIPSCDGFGIDRMEVTIDGTVVFMVNDTSPVCGTSPYVPVVLDISSHLNSTFTLRFHGSTDSLFTVTNFFVDDVDINVSVPVELQTLEIE